jgi:hypothetical protein
MPAVEAWLENGPAAGKILAVETRPDGSLPHFDILTAVGVYVRAVDEPAADVTAPRRRRDG